MQQGGGLAVRWVSAAEAAALDPTLAPDGHRGGSYLETDGHIDPPRERPRLLPRHAAAGVELRERTAFTGLRTEPTPGRRPRVVAVETDRGPIATERVS
jgi:sarcosine oxidase subunit beta